MNIDTSLIIKGKTYLVAVSGGVDSVTLLHILASFKDQLSATLVVAHFDHGIRNDSGEDAVFVKDLAESLRLDFEVGHGNLPVNASEATARKARYQFLQSLKLKHGAAGIMTAHHEDDVLETALLNLLRGCGRKGITSLRSTPSLIRPLLKVSRKAILCYASEHKITWREDSTNASDTYRRNYIRHHVMTRLSDVMRQDILGRIELQANLNDEIDNILASVVSVDNLPRNFLLQFSYKERMEVLAAWLKIHGLACFDRPLLERLAISMVTLKPGRKIEVCGESYVLVGSKVLVGGFMQGKSV